MGGQQRVYKQKIRATETLEKVFRAMEMIAASRIGAARKRAVEADPYTRALTAAVAAVAVHSDIHHPLTQANVITTDFSDWATNCPEYKVTAVQVAVANASDAAHIGEVVMADPADSAQSAHDGRRRRRDRVQS